MNKKYGIEAVQPLHFTLRFYAQIFSSFDTLPDFPWFDLVYRFVSDGIYTN